LINTLKQNNLIVKTQGKHPVINTKKKKKKKKKNLPILPSTSTTLMNFRGNEIAILDPTPPAYVGASPEKWNNPNS
jgi:hypothetical protein